MDTNAPIAEDLKKSIYDSLADALINGLEVGTITEEDAQSSSALILDQLEALTSREQVIAFLGEISTRWPVYKEVLLKITEQQNTQEDNQQIEKAREQLENIAQ